MAYIETGGFGTKTDPRTAAIYSMLDPQAQMSLTGAATTTRPGGVVNYTGNANTGQMLTRAAQTLTQQQTAGTGTYSGRPAPTPYWGVGAPGWPGTSTDIGGGGGGSGVTTTPTETGTTTSVTGPTTVADILAELGLTGVTEAQLNATLEALAAQYGVQLADLLNQRDLFIDAYGNPGPLVQQALTELQRKYTESREGAISDLLSRGIYRSGIAAEDIGKIEQARTEGEGNIFGDQQQQLGGIQGQMDALKQWLASEEAKARADIDMQNMQFALQAKLGGL